MEAVPKRILIADDRLSFVSTLSDFLAELGYEVLAVDNGRDAIQRALSEPVDLILLDIMLPFVDGYLVAQQITGKLGPKAPKIIMMTGRDMGEEMEVALKSGACDVLVKPFPLPELQKRIEDILG